MLLVAALSGLSVGSGSAAAAAVIVYQCGPGVCTISPSGGAPHSVTAQGTLAGVTADGATVSWVDSSNNLVQAPLAGGAATTIYPGFDYAAPTMSPDGRSYVAYSYFTGLGFFIYRYDVGADSPASIDSAISSVTYGWLGSIPLVAHAGSSDYVSTPSRICRIDAGAQCSPGTPIIQETRGVLGYPYGSPDGSEIVAVVGPGSAWGLTDTGGGFLALYSARTGALIKNLTSTGDQYDAEPRFSADGGSIVFERLDHDGQPSQIVTVDVANGAQRVAAAGANPFYAGAATTSTPGGPGPRVVSRTNPLRHLRAATRKKRPRHGLAVTFKAVRTTRVAIVVRKGHHKLGTLHKRFRKGTRTLTLRRVGKSKLKRGTRYTVTLSAPHAKALTIRLKSR